MVSLGRWERTSPHWAAVGRRFLTRILSAEMHFPLIIMMDTLTANCAFFHDLQVRLSMIYNVVFFLILARKECILLEPHFSPSAPV